MSTIRGWLSPLDHRGMALWGSVACLFLGFELASVQGLLTEVWPNRCHMVRNALVSEGDRGSASNHLQVTFDQAHHLTSPKQHQVDNERGDLWVVPTNANEAEVQRVDWLIPKRQYSGARVRLNRLTPMWVELYSDELPSVMLFYEHDRPVESLYHFLVGDASLTYLFDRGMNEFQGQFSKATLEDLAYEITPEMITCDPARLEYELPQLLSLMLKSTEVGVQRAIKWDDDLWEYYSDLNGHKRRLIRRRVAALNRGKAIWSISWAHTAQSERRSAEISANDTPPTWIKQLLTAIDQAQGSPKRARELMSALPKQVSLLQER